MVECWLSIHGATEDSILAPHKPGVVIYTYKSSPGSWIGGQGQFRVHSYFELSLCYMKSSLKNKK